MTPTLRKIVLTAHLTASIGWLGAVIVFLVLSITGLVSQDAQLVRATDLAMELSARLVIVPLALASLLTGIVQSLGTPWGLFRHYWILAKLLLTVFATVVLLLKMEQISRVAAATLASSDLRQARLQLTAHAGGGLLVLLVTATLSVFKPWGRTRYGLRKQQQAFGETPMPISPPRSDADHEPTKKGIPVGFKIILVVIGVIAVGFVVRHLIGGGLMHHHMH